MSPSPCSRLHLLPAQNPMRREAVLGAHPAGPVVACDFYVEGAEEGEEAPGGYRLGRLLNVDHHAPTPRMSRRISSTNLAIAHVAAEGVDPDAAVVLNHTDCDSVLSGAIMAGILPPDPRYGAAAIAADHTGEADPISDLLQALDRLRDPCLSLDSLVALEQGKRLAPMVQARLANRERLRGEAEAYVAGGRFHAVGRVFWAVLDESVDGTFFPALLPEAWLILLAIPLVPGPDRHEVKLRLGLAAPPGMTLHDLGVRDIDPAFGGRWNAGANRRAGGTSLPAEAYAAALWARITARFPAPASPRRAPRG